jgi:hypothetical protein
MLRRTRTRVNCSRRSCGSPRLDVGGEGLNLKRGEELPKINGSVSAAQSFRGERSGGLEAIRASVVRYSDNKRAWIGCLGAG